MQSSLTLSASNISIERSDRLLCQALSFQVGSGEILHIIGENGAGKSSLLKVIVGVLEPLSGKLYFAGEHISLCRETLQAELLYIGHSTAVKNVYTALENLRLYHPDLADEQLCQALQSVNLSDHIFTEAYQLSAGQKKRIALARLWLTNRKVWILDEPFTTLDKTGVKVLEDRLKEHVDRGGVAVLTTHQNLSPSLNVKELYLSE